MFGDVKTDFGPPYFRDLLHPVIAKNYGKWKYHEVVRPGVIKRVAESGDVIYVVRFGTPRLVSIFTVRELCDIADKYSDGYLRWTSRNNVEFFVTDESKIDDLINEVQEKVGFPCGARGMPARVNTAFQTSSTHRAGFTATHQLLTHPVLSRL